MNRRPLILLMASLAAMSMGPGAASGAVVFKPQPSPPDVPPLPRRRGPRGKVGKRRYPHLPPKEMGFYESILCAKTRERIEDLLAEVRGLNAAGRASNKTLNRCRRAAVRRLELLAAA